MACVWIRVSAEPFPGGGVEKEEGLTCPFHLLLFPANLSVSPERSAHMFEFHHWVPPAATHPDPEMVGGVSSSGWEAG